MSLVCVEIIGFQVTCTVEDSFYESFAFLSARSPKGYHQPGASLGFPETWVLYIQTSNLDALIAYERLPSKLQTVR